MSIAAHAPAAAPGFGRSLAVALALARVEGMRFVRHPLSAIGALLGTALVVGATWFDAPALNRYDSLASESLVRVAVALLVIAHLATMRPARHRTTELHASAPTREGLVTVGLLLAVVLAGCSALLLAIGHLV